MTGLAVREATPATPSQDDASHTGSVGVLLCTRNGAQYLEEQLRSISDQTHTEVHIVASDDGSDDGTLDILHRYAAQSPNRRSMRIQGGPRRGATANFLSLASDPNIAGDYFAYCDQDDIWLPDKLERALGWLRAVPKSIPALYCSRTILIDRDGRYIGVSPAFKKPPSFRNALVQNLAGGNTMVFNECARGLLVSAGPLDVISHDWWTYTLVTGSGGLVRHDQLPSLQYRQHGKNLVGSLSGLPGYVRRFRRFASGEVSAWNSKNTAALMRCAHMLLPENRQILKSFTDMQSHSLVRRLRGFISASPYRQTTLGQASLLFALLTHRL